MARRSKKLATLRKYRDKLLARLTKLEEDHRELLWICHEARMNLIANDNMRAFAFLAGDQVSTEEYKEFNKNNKLVSELALVFRQLNVEREYTMQIQKAVGQRDWVRVLALSADHEDEAVAHNKQLDEWEKENGAMKDLIRRDKEMEDGDE